MLVKPNEPDEEELIRAVLRLNKNILGLACGLLCGLTIFIATVVLVVKGGEKVGPHLQLLNQFFPGYSVTVAGGFIGLAYGFATGYLVGWLIAWIYNRIVVWKGL